MYNILHLMTQAYAIGTSVSNMCIQVLIYMLLNFIASFKPQNSNNFRGLTTNETLTTCLQQIQTCTLILFDLNRSFQSFQPNDLVDSQAD